MDRGETISHDIYMHAKVTCSAIFSLAIRRGVHPGPNPENQTTVRNYGHKNHRKNGAYDLNEIKQFFLLAMILRNSPEVCRRYYLRLDATASKQSAMDTLEKAYLEERINIQ
jgi:hypothetical protein